MVNLNFPDFSFRTRHDAGALKIFDSLRGIWVALTPEEWVRQHMIRYLVEIKSYPAGLIKVEHALKVNRMKRRADLVVFSKTGIPSMIIECKAPEVKMTQKILDQAARYNITLHVPFLSITNGLQHYCCKIQYHDGKIEVLPDIPEFSEL